MTISGPDMHRQLMNGYKGVQQRIDDMRNQLSAIDSEKGELREDRGDALLDLAEHYLPELSRESIESSWIEVRERLNRVLMRKEDQRRRVSDALDDVGARRDREEQRLLNVNQSLDEARKDQDDLAEKVKSELAADQTFVSLSGRAAVAEAALERAEANLSEIEQDAARKLPAYERSSLFAYLRDEGFGTEDYQKRGFSRRMDRWVAKFVNFHQAKQSYDFLTNTPEQMRKIIAEDRDALDTVMEELESRRDLATQRCGLSAAIEKCEQLETRREAQLIDLDRIREQSESLERELTDLDDTRGSYYQEAIEVFREMLKEFETQDLVSKARGTASLTDDQIVARIQGADDKMGGLDEDTRQYKDDIREMQRCVEALGRLMQRFRASKFDAGRSEFLPSVDVLGELNRAHSEEDIDELWNRLRRAQRWGPTISDQLGNVASHPVTQVLIGAMAQAAGAAMSDHAHRAGRRRYQNPRYGRFSSWSGDSSSDHRQYRR